MTTRTSVELSKLLLVACDQAYFDYGTLALNTPLQHLEDRAPNPPSEYLNTNIYKQKPDYTVAPGYLTFRRFVRFAENIPYS